MERFDSSCAAVMPSRKKSCATTAMWRRSRLSGNKTDQRRKVAELMDVMARAGR